MDDESQVGSTQKMKKFLNKIFSQEESDYLEGEQRRGIIDLFIFLDLKYPSKYKINISKTEARFIWYKFGETVSEYIDRSSREIKKLIIKPNREFKFLKKIAKKIDGVQLIEIIQEIYTKSYPKPDNEKDSAEIDSLFTNLKFYCKLYDSRRKMIICYFCFGIPIFILLLFAIVNPAGLFWTLGMLCWGMSSNTASIIGAFLATYVFIYFFSGLGCIFHTYKASSKHNYFNQLKMRKIPWSSKAATKV